MTDRLTLARALEEGSASRDAAEQIATEFYDNVAKWCTIRERGSFSIERAARSDCELSVRYVRGGKWQWLVNKDGLATRRAP